MSFDSDGGVMHGVWSSDFAMSTSDRRLKTDIQELNMTIQEYTL